MLAQQYKKDGFLTSVNILSPEDTLKHRQQCENAEKKIGKLHYKYKIHTVLKSPHQLATHPKILDIVEQLIGKDILIYNVSYIIKEPQSKSFVSWHQDLTYWGLSSDDQVSMWLALSPATRQSGCMEMISGSHKQGKLEHHRTEDNNNVLYNGQTINNIDETQATLCDLQPGEASFHHGWTVHRSMPNLSDDRRIGLNVQYIASHVRQLDHNHDTAMLVRGEDNYGYYKYDTAPQEDFNASAIEKMEILNNIMKNATRDSKG